MPISLPGLPSNYPVPSNYVFSQYAAGTIAANQGAIKTIIIGNGNGGTSVRDNAFYGPDTQVVCAQESDVITLAGSGSEVHRQWRAFTAVNGISPLYIGVVTSGTGTATGTITITGTANVAQTIRVFVEQEFVDTAVNIGDTQVTIATNIVASINSKIYWSVTASNTSSSNVVTLSAKCSGVKGNWINFESQVILPAVLPTTLINNVPVVVTPAPTVVSAGAVSPPTTKDGYYLSGGSTPDNNTTMLATIKPFNFNYIVSSWAGDGTVETDGYGAASNVGRLAAQVQANALPLIGFRQRYIIGSIMSTSSNPQYIANALDDFRAGIIWQLSSDYTPSYLAASVAGTITSIESNFGSASCNFDGVSSVSNPGQWAVQAPRGKQAPLATQLVSALNAGVSPIQSTQYGTAYLVKLITTYSLNPVTSSVDYRVRDWHKVTVCDNFANDLQALFSASLGQRVVTADPAGGTSPSNGAVTPSIVKSLVFGLIDTYANALVLDPTQTAATKAGTIVSYNPALASNIIYVLVPLHPINILDSTQSLLQQVS